MTTRNIAIIGRDPLTNAVSQAIALFEAVDVIYYPIESSVQQQKLPRTALLILNETQIYHLATLRRQNFPGPVLILTTNPHSNPIQTHRILQWGQGSHAVFTAPYSLPQLLRTIPDLVPLEPENLKMLQRELQAPQRWFKTHILPTLQQLTQDPHQPQAIDRLIELISTIRAHTPAACHTPITIDGQTAQIQQHLKLLADTLLAGKATPTTITHLHQTFEQWRNLTLNGGEGLGTFS